MLNNVGPMLIQCWANDSVEAMKQQIANCIHISEVRLA